MKFRYHALDSNGTEVREELEADNQKEAISKIRQKGLFPTKITNAEEKRIEPVARADDVPAINLGDLLGGFMENLQVEEEPRMTMEEFTTQVKKEIEGQSDTKSLAIAIAMGCKVIGDSIVEHSEGGPKALKAMFGDSYKGFLDTMTEKLKEEDEAESWKRPKEEEDDQ